MNVKKLTTTAKANNQSKPLDRNPEEIPSLIWYNKNNEEKNEENLFIYYNNCEECIEAIKHLTKPIFLILNSSSATDLLSRVHSLKQIDIIFIYCKSSREHQRCQYLLEHYSKIFDLFINQKKLFDIIHENINLYQHQSGNDYLRLAERYYKEKNELNYALKYTHKALEIYKKKFSNSNHPLIARCLNNLGGIYDAQGDVNRSFEYYEQAIKMYSQLTPSLSSQPVSNLLKK